MVDVAMNKEGVAIVAYTHLLGHTRIFIYRIMVYIYACYICITFWLNHKLLLNLTHSRDQNTESTCQKEAVVDFRKFKTLLVAKR